MDKSGFLVVVLCLLCLSLKTPTVKANTSECELADTDQPTLAPSTKASEDLQTLSFELRVIRTPTYKEPLVGIIRRPADKIEAALRFLREGRLPFSSNTSPCIFGLKLNGESAWLGLSSLLCVTYLLDYQPFWSYIKRH